MIGGLARQNRCPWNENTCSGAANGYIEVLQWPERMDGMKILVHRLRKMDI